jgi:hypothetical protein
MSALEVLALDTATPQIRAPGASDTYKLPRAAEVIQGTNAAPAVAFTGDTDTGLYSPGANEVALATGGTGRLTIDGSGNVNIPGTLAVTGAITGSVTGTAANVTGTVAVANGGTGQTTYTDGQLLIGNSTGNTLTKATLTSGSGISITNGSGSVTIASTVTGTVTSVSGTGTVNGITLTGTVTSTGSLTLGGALTGVDLSTQVTGTLPLANGGTGQTSAQLAINSLAGAVTSGQYLRGNGTNVVMSAIQAADVPTLNQNTTGTAAGLSATLAVSSGGTGQTSYTNGQLLIGNTTGNTLTKATLTAGTGITITNGAGSITVAASSTGGAQDYIVQSYGIV